MKYTTFSIFLVFLVMGFGDAVGPLVITSGYRSPRHSIEAAKNTR